MALVNNFFQELEYEHTGDIRCWQVDEQYSSSQGEGASPAAKDSGCA